MSHSHQPLPPRLLTKTPLLLTHLNHRSQMLCRIPTYIEGVFCYMNTQPLWIVKVYASTALSLLPVGKVTLMLSNF